PQIWLAPTADDSDGWLASVRHIAIESGAFVVSVPQYIPASAFPPGFPVPIPPGRGGFRNRGAGAAPPAAGGGRAAPPSRVGGDREGGVGRRGRCWLGAVGDEGRGGVPVGGAAGPATAAGEPGGNGGADGDEN